jgi:hypothetical protein
VIKPAAGYQGPLAYSSPEAVQTTGTVAGQLANLVIASDRQKFVIVTVLNLPSTLD